MNNNKYLEATTNKYLNKKMSTLSNTKNNIIQKRMFSKASSDTTNFNPFDGSDFNWFDGRKFSEVQKDPNFVRNASQLSDDQYTRYIEAAKEFNTSQQSEYPISAPIPDLVTTDISANPSWYKMYAFDSSMRNSYLKDFVKDWKKYVPVGVEATPAEAEKVWQDITTRSWDKFIKDRGGNYDAMPNPMGKQELIPNSESDNGSGGGQWDGSNENDWSYDPKPNKDEYPKNPRGYGFSQESDKFYSYKLPADDFGFKSNKIIFPGIINPKRLPTVSSTDSTDPYNPSKLKFTPEGEFTQTYTDDPITADFIRHSVYPYQTKTKASQYKPEKNGILFDLDKPLDWSSWWKKLLNFDFKSKAPKKVIKNPLNPNPGMPPSKSETADTAEYPDKAYEDDDYEKSMGKSAKKRGSMNKMMGGKSGRMGPEIKDDDGTSGRYFQKKAKRQSSSTYKFYETDKPHSSQMQSMQQNMLTKAQMLNAKKMHEINNENYYGVEKPQPKNTFRKNSMSMGNSINIGGGNSSSLMPRKNSYSIDTPRQKTPSPMGGIKHNPFFKPSGGSLKNYNPYPRSGGMATGMPPTMSGGFSTAKRMTKRATKPQSVRSKYGC